MTSLSDLYLCFPNRTSADVYEVVLGGAPHNVVHTVGDAITSPISTVEAAPSDGAYTRTLTAFYLPAVQVSGWSPKAGYPLVANGVKYTIHNVGDPVAAGLWLCECVLLAIDPERADVVTIIFPALSMRDAYGSRILTPGVQAENITCWIQPLSLAATDQLDKRGFTEFYFCYTLAAIDNVVYGSIAVDQNGTQYVVVGLEQRRNYFDAARLLLAIRPEALEVAP